MLPRLVRAESSTDGLLLAIWRTGVWRLMLFLIIYSIGLAIIFPITPTLMTNGFASLAAGHHLDCSTFAPDDSPTECTNAHSTVVVWMSITNFISSSVLTFFCAPVVGALSDRLGRKPFMLMGVALTLLPLAAILLHLHDVLPIYWYFPASAAGGVVSSFTMTLTSVADLMEQRHRAIAVGYLTSCFSMGMLVGPLMGGYLSITSAMWTCIAMTVVTWLYVALVVPECAPGPLARRAAAKAAKAGAIDDKDAGGEQGCGSVSGCARVDDGGKEEPGESGVLVEEVLAAVEAVSLVAGQWHLMGCGAVADAIGAEDGGAVYSNSSTAEAVADCCPRDGGRGGNSDDDVLLPYRRLGERRCSGSQEAAASSAVTADGGRTGDGDGGAAIEVLSSSWAVIRDSSFYQCIAAIWVVVSMTWEGAGELLMQYLQYKLGFNTRDQAHVLTVLAAGGLVVKLGLLAPLVRCLGERRLLGLGLAAYATECLALALARSKTAGLAAVSIGSLASVCWPALTALQTAGVHPAQQGAVFGALQAVSAMASGLGPLVFAAVFRAVTRTDSRLPPMSGVVWYMAVALTAVAIALTISLPDHHQQGQQKKDQQGGRQSGQGEGKVDAGGISRFGRRDVEAVGGEEGRRRATGVPEEEKEEGPRVREERASRGGLREPLLQGQAPGGV